MTIEQEKMNNLEQKVENLEIKVSFQEHTIEELNDALTKQQADIDKLTAQIRFLLDKLKAMEPSNIANASEETPPPHY